MIFADTNILVYAADTSEAAKRPIAKELLREAVASRSLVLSTQVLQEFYVTVLRHGLLPPERAARAIRLWAEESDVVTVTPELVFQAVDLQQRYRFSFWDALIVQAALHAGCTTLFTEDLQHGQKIGGLEIVNPFRQGVHEEPAAYLHASTGASVDKVLRQAIARKSLIGLVYEGRPKEGEPHDYGRINGRLRLNFYQTKGRGRTGVEESGVWKTLDTAKITQLRLLERSFGGTRPAARGAHKRWDELIASVTARASAG